MPAAFAHAGLGSDAMDLGLTQSNKSSPFHFITGLVVVSVGFTAMMFVIRPLVVG
ncbi:MAG: hypothetical protein ABIP55_07760 [Tepidisphaeraceae bacterium]